MNKNFDVIFTVRDSKRTADGTSPIHLRITIDGKRLEISTKRSIEIRRWNRVAQKATGNTDEIRSLNMYLKSLEQNVFDVYHELVREKITPSPSILKNRLFGETERAYSLIEVVKMHNKEMAALVNKKYSPTTLKRFQTVQRIVEEFLKWKYKVADIDIKNMDHGFVTSLDFYLRFERNCNNNTSCKYIKNLKKIVSECVSNGWLSKDPFAKFKIKIEEVPREVLTEIELNTLSDKKFVIERLEHVRDVFLFCCYTGLAHADVKKLQYSEIVTGIDGRKWIITSRLKTATVSKIPLLDIPVRLIKKYQEHPICKKTGLVLPVLSNQKMNAYLQEIKEICGISKPLTSHIARHTFATTVTLSHGVPIETVSKMLGHKSLRTTQIYAKVLDKKLSDDMNALRRKLESGG